MFCDEKIMCMYSQQLNDMHNIPSHAGSGKWKDEGSVVYTDA